LGCVRKLALVAPGTATPLVAVRRFGDFDHIPKVQSDAYSMDQGEITVKKIFMLFAIEFLLVAGAMSAVVVHAHSIRISSHT
jgi:hypothetical protein